MSLKIGREFLFSVWDFWILPVKMDEGLQDRNRGEEGKLRSVRADDDVSRVTRVSNHDVS